MQLVSIEAIVWALYVADVDGDGHYVGADRTRLVLVALADYADELGRGAHPATRTLAERLRLDRWAVQHALNSLERQGRIVPTARAVPRRRGVTYDLPEVRGSCPQDRRLGGGSTTESVVHSVVHSAVHSAVHPPPNPDPDPDNPPTPRADPQRRRRAQPGGDRRGHADPVTAVALEAAERVCALRAANGYGAAGDRAIAAAAGQITQRLGDVAARWIDVGYRTDRIATALADRFLGTNPHAVPFSPGEQR